MKFAICSLRLLKYLLVSLNHRSIYSFSNVIPKRRHFSGTQKSGVTVTRNFAATREKKRVPNWESCRRMCKEMKNELDSSRFRQPDFAVKKKGTKAMLVTWISWVPQMALLSSKDQQRHDFGELGFWWSMRHGERASRKSMKILDLRNWRSLPRITQNSLWSRNRKMRSSYCS
jgi:hypothetical protein